MAQRNKLHWFPVSPVDLLTLDEFRHLTDEEFGACIRLGCYLWMYDEIPTEGMWASGSYRKIAQLTKTWIDAIRIEQAIKFEAASERGRMAQSRKSAYRQKLADPRWKKKRRKIIKRDGNACKKCGAINRTLQVHHLWYENGREPWAYPDDALVTLCEPCHKEGVGG